MLVFAILSLIFFNFVGCEKFKLDNLTANRHIKEGNRLYGDEMYKQAIPHYEEALRLNPALTKYYVYLGTACSMAYQPSILPPEKNDRYKHIEETNDRLNLEIEEAKAAIEEFKTRDDLMVLIKKKADIEAKLKKAKDEIRLISVELLETGRSIDYSKYSGYKTKVTSAKRRLADNENFFQKIEAKENQPIEENAVKDGEEKGGSLAAIQAEWERKRNIERRKKQLKVDKTIIENDSIYVETFEKDLSFIDKKNEIEEYDRELNECVSQLESSEDYMSYVKQLDDVEYKTKEIKYNKNYKNEVVDNEKIRNLAVEYLTKALETAKDDVAVANKTGNEKKIKAAVEIENKILTGLSDLYSKMIPLQDKNESFFKESEKYRKMILAKDPDNLDNYYVMADFYQDHMKIDRVMETYQERMNLDPKDPGVYHRYSRFLRNARIWNASVEMGLRRIYALLSPDVLIPLTVKLNEIEKNRTKAKQVDLFFNNVMSQKSLPLKDRRDMVDQKKAEMKEAGELTLKEIDTKLAEIRKQISELYQAEVLDKLTDIKDVKLKKALKEAYFDIGVTCWTQSHYTEDVLLPRDERKVVIENGFKFCNNALKIDPEYVDVIIYKSLLWRQMIKVDGLKSKEFLKKAEELSAIYKKESERISRKRIAQQKMEELNNN
jgi:tetratricopeptide (TPR) repeat protein